jgi:glycolate oxidase FAD binding subunit
MSTPAAMTVEQGLAHLGSIVGQEHVQLCGGAYPVVVAAPADVGQIAEVLRFANGNGLAVTASGGRTRLGWGNPVAPDIELSMARISAVREHAWQDMTCSVESGCTWAHLQDHVSKHGQMVALDPLWPERATVGGIVATNDSGALRLKYGGLRDLIIGMTIVLADGTIAKSGGKVVKNVAGYDMHKLMTGSFGTLGVIAEVNFRLHPMEDHARTWTAALTDGTPLAFAEPMRALADSMLVPSCVQMRVSRQKCAVDVRVAGLPECLEEYGAVMRSIFGGFALTEAVEDVWAARQKLFDKPDALVLKVSVLPDEICAVGARLREWGAESGCVVETVAQATGLISVAITADQERGPALLDRLRASVSPGASVVVLHAPEALREKIDVWGPDRGTLPLMREIKRRFDPNRILNPGRFVGHL